MSEHSWERHAHPWSGWTRFIGFFVLIGGLWYHAWLLVGLTIVYIMINPVLFPKPKHYDHWMSKAVLGEQKWTSDRKNHKKLVVMAVVGFFAFFGILFSAYHNQLVPTVLLFISIIAFKFWYLNEMVVYYTHMKKR